MLDFSFSICSYNNSVMYFRLKDITAILVNLAGLLHTCIITDIII